MYAERNTVSGKDKDDRKKHVHEKRPSSTCVLWKV